MGNKLVVYNNENIDYFEDLYYDTYTGSEVPISSLGNNGDYYFQTVGETELVYKKINSTWFLQNAGGTGIGGITGPQGNQGVTGLSGSNGEVVNDSDILGSTIKDSLNTPPYISDPICSGPLLRILAGIILSDPYLPLPGHPVYIKVTFGVPFIDDQYAITAQIVNGNGDYKPLRIIRKTAQGFIIILKGDGATQFCDIDFHVIETLIEESNSSGYYYYDQNQCQFSFGSFNVTINDTLDNI